MATIGSPLRQHWNLDPEVSFLNHGSFGACPRTVLEEQGRLRDELETEPVRFLVRELESRLDRALQVLGAFVGAETCDLAFVPNATAGVNAVLRSLDFAPGDKILITDHAYGACDAAVRYVARRTGARVVVAHVPFPISSGDEVIQAVLEHAGPNVRLAMLDHVTSPTAVVFPIAELVSALAARGIDTLVDGAHAPGMLPLDIAALDAAYYVGNCHKWLCAPKGSGFLHVRRDRQDRIVPPVVSHGWTSRRADRSRFRQLFDWTGTSDPTAALSVPAALDFLPSLLPGGWPEVMAANRALAIRARNALCETLGLERPASDVMLGAMASVPLPGAAPEVPAGAIEPLQEALWRDERIEVPVFRWGDPPRRIVRVSAHLYNSDREALRLAHAIRARTSRQAA
jgi:isopenicillin-N epimerase